MKFVYIAGPYTGKTHDHCSYWEIDRNINRSLEAMQQLAQVGLGAFSPHGHSAHFEVIAPDVPATYWYELDLHFLKACDGILMLSGWENSKESLKEKARAEELGMPVFYSVGGAIAYFLIAPGRSQ